jgi:hypothetical protein
MGLFIRLPPWAGDALNAASLRYPGSGRAAASKELSDDSKRNLRGWEAETCAPSSAGGNRAWIALTPPAVRPEREPDTLRTMEGEPQEEITPQLAEAVRRRSDLHHSLVDAEVAISSAAAGREEAWAKGVVEKLTALRESIEEHIEGTERPGGLYDEILGKAPRLSGAIERLKAEHPVMRDATSEVMSKLRTTGVGPAWPLEEARDDIQRMLGQIVKHRQLGADLVWEAYNLDIGGVD